VPGPRTANIWYVYGIITDHLQNISITAKS
jgi:hypothetical protein